MCEKDPVTLSFFKKVCSLPHLKKTKVLTDVSLLFLFSDQLNILEQSKFVNDLLRDKETVFYGNLPQNEVLFTLRKYQQELIKSALSQNRYAPLSINPSHIQIPPFPHPSLPPLPSPLLPYLLPP